MGRCPRLAIAPRRVRNGQDRRTLSRPAGVRSSCGERPRWPSATYVGIRTEGDLRICTLNVNALFADKFMQILAFMAEFQIDVFICVDTRISLVAAKSFGIVARQTLGLGTWTGACDFGRPRPTHKRKSTQAAGGQFIIVSPRYGGAVRDFRQDWTGLGVASSFTLPCAAGRLMIVGSYWPTPGSKSGDSNKLSDRLRQELVARGIRKAPWS